MDKLENLLSRFDKVRKTRDGYKMSCNSHVDRTQSLFIKQEEDRLLLHCFASCSTQEILSNANLTMSDLFINSGEETEMTALATVQKREEDKGKDTNLLKKSKMDLKL